MSTNSDPFHLTVRETQVLQLLSEGQTGRQISEILNVAHTTVKTYVERMKNKLGVRNIVELIYVTSKLGII